MNSGGPRRGRVLLAFVAATQLAGCVGLPPGPAVPVKPGKYAPPEQFRADDGGCRQWVVSVYGPAALFASEAEAQWAYDRAYAQCMYARGHAVPRSMAPVVPPPLTAGSTPSPATR